FTSMARTPLRRSPMFIVRQPTQPPSSVGAKYFCGRAGRALRRNMSLLRSWRSILEPTSYKYSVPNGTGCVVTNLVQKTKSFDLATQREDKTPEGRYEREIVPEPQSEPIPCCVRNGPPRSRIGPTTTRS